MEFLTFGDPVFGVLALRRSLTSFLQLPICMAQNHGCLMPSLGCRMYTRLAKPCANAHDLDSNS